MYNIKTSEKTLKFDTVVVNKKRFHASKQAMALHLVDRDKIVISNRFTRSHNRSKYFICYKEDDFMRPSCIILPQISGHIKYFDDGGKNMS